LDGWFYEDVDLIKIIHQIMKEKLILIFALGLLSQIGMAQKIDKIKLDSYFDALETHNKFMGSVAVSKDGEVIYAKAVGYMDLENNVKSDENSKYRIGSISKTFTAVLTLKAVEMGKLDLDQTIDMYFPGIEHADKITIQHLLYHRSGIHNFTNDEVYFTYNTEAKSEAEMVEIITKAGSDFAPDSKADYSNSNYVLLTYILEKSFDMSYADLLKEHITQPLGLINTYLGGRINAQDNETHSYKFIGNWKRETETDISIPLGAGGIVSTASDLVKFSDALFGGKLLKTTQMEQMKTIKDDFGIGIFQIPFYDKLGYGHTGGIDGFTSVFSHFADGNISYALVSNGSNYNYNDISITVMSEIFGKPYDIPEFTTYEVNADDLKKYPGVYASPQFPLKITISVENNTLIAQATGQPSFPLEAADKDIFRFDQAGLVLEFNPAENTMTLKQGGGEFKLTKE